MSRVARRVPLGERHEWSDVVPVPASDGGSGSPVPVATSAEFRDVMGYFRAVVRDGEVSERALGLTADVVGQNPASYTAWAWRLKCLDALGTRDWDGELAWVGGWGARHTENYQVWQHRRAVAERAYGAPGSAELARREGKFSEGPLGEDAKNYHAWAHRQWCLAHDPGFEEALLAADPFNNSCWNHRHFVIRRGLDGGTGGFGGDGVLAREVGFVRAALEASDRALASAPEGAERDGGTLGSNDAAWEYVRGAHRDAGARLSDSDGLVALVVERCFSKGPQRWVDVAWGDLNGLGVLLDMLVEDPGGAFLARPSGRRDSPEEGGGEGGAKAEPPVLLSAVALCEALMDRDRVRAGYWAIRRAQLLPLDPSTDDSSTS